MRWLLLLGCTSCMFQTLANARLENVDDAFFESNATDEAPVVHRAASEARAEKKIAAAPVATSESVTDARTSVVTLKANRDKAEVLEQPVEPPRTVAVDDAPAYEAALQLFNANAFGKTITALTDFIHDHPNDAKVQSALYWRAEAYAASGDCAHAIADLGAVLARGAGDKEPDALFAMGTCQTNVGNPRAARDAFRKLQVEFPRSDAAHRLTP